MNMPLRLGMNSPQIAQLQVSLRNLGYGIVPTGMYTMATQDAVRHFQASRGLVVDGVVNSNTWTAIVESLTPPSNPRPIPVAGTGQSSILPSGPLARPIGVAGGLANADVMNRRRF